MSLALKRSVAEAETAIRAQQEQQQRFASVLSNELLQHVHRDERPLSRPGGGIALGGALEHPSLRTYPL